MGYLSIIMMCPAKFLQILDHKKLYQMIYEKANYDQTTKIDPHLWIYRPIITIDHVAKSLQQLKDSVKTDLTILQEFLKNVRCYINTYVLKNCYSVTHIIIVCIG